MCFVDIGRLVLFANSFRKPSKFFNAFEHRGSSLVANDIAELCGQKANFTGKSLVHGGNS